MSRIDKAPFTVFGRRTDYTYVYDIKSFPSLADAVEWKRDFQSGKVRTPNGDLVHDKSTIHLFDNRGGYEVDEQGAEVIHSDWLTGQPIVHGSREAFMERFNGATNVTVEDIRHSGKVVIPRGTRVEVDDTALPGWARYEGRVYRVSGVQMSSTEIQIDGRYIEGCGPEVP